MRFDLLKVLIVDDNLHMRTLLANVLGAVGAGQIHQATDGMEGLALLSRHSVNLVITDLSMQPLDGIDFVTLLRRSPDSPNPRVPVIMMTGHATPDQVNTARDAGVSEFLTKPLDARTIVERVQWAMENPRPFIATTTYSGPDRRRRAAPEFRGPWRRAGDGARWTAP